MILVLGADGILGSELRKFKNDSAMIFLGHKECDIADLCRVKHVVQDVKPDVVVNCAAYTDVDQAESQEERAFEVNASGALHAALAVNAISARLIHISTDYIFDGTLERAYRENDYTSPLSVYGKTKLQGEEYIRKNAHDYCIIRTSLLYSNHTSSFFHTLLDRVRQNQLMKGVIDRISSPTRAFDLADLIINAVIPFSEKKMAETFHYSNLGCCTMLEFISKLVGIYGSESEVISTPFAEMNYKAQRPVFSSLDSSKIMNHFGVNIAHWEDSLALEVGAVRKMRI